MARYIDADRLKEHIKDLPTWWADGGGVYGQSMKYPEGMFDCEDIINSIDNQPTADVEEVKHGEWVNVEGFVVCERCGSSPAYWEPKPNNPKGYPPRCHECGAKMDGGNAE